MLRVTTGPARADLLVAGGCALVVLTGLVALPALAELEPDVADSLPGPGHPDWWAALALLATQTLALAWRRRRPVTVLVVAAAAVPLGAAAGLGSAIGLTSVAYVVAVYTVATLVSPGRAGPLAGLTGVLVAAGHVAAGVRSEVPPGEAVAVGLVQAITLTGGPLLVAALVVARRESRAAREDRVRALERERDAVVQAAVARERTAMARELHDIAAHHLTGISVMSAAIATQIDTDPAAAKDAVREVRRQSTAVLRDLRSLVGLLRDQDADAPSDARVETLAGVPALVDGVVAGGQDVGLLVLGPADGREPGAGIGPLAQLAAYRMVQEALANARRHAAEARCEVEVDDRDPAALVVTVRNEPAPPGAGPPDRGGLGLVGMQERADLTASRLDAGPTADGGWQVRLRIPRAGDGDRT